MKLKKTLVMVEIKLEELKLFNNIIAVMTKRGAFVIEEYKVIGELAERTKAYLEKFESK